MSRRGCAKCSKGAGVTTCDGCRQFFCITHIVEHRKELGVELDYFGQEYDVLQQDIQQEHSQHPLLSEINRWEQQSIRKIQTVANTARMSLEEIMNKKSNQLKVSMRELREEFRKQRDADGYTEIDLERWSEKLNNLRTLLKKMPCVRIRENENVSDSIRLIRIVQDQEQRTQLVSRTFIEHKRELFDKDKVSKYSNVSENGLVVRHIGSTADCYQCVLGTNMYYSDIHDIHFRIEKKGEDNFFFGIVTASQEVVKNIFDLPSAYGCWGSYRAVIAGKRQKKNDSVRDMRLYEGDTLKITLDCDKKQVKFQNMVTLDVDVRLCPLPWKIAVSLSRKNDCLRIIHT